MSLQKKSVGTMRIAADALSCEYEGCKRTWTVSKWQPLYTVNRCIGVGYKVQHEIFASQTSLGISQLQL
jgi:hypothetical protein